MSVENGTVTKTSPKPATKIINRNRSGKPGENGNGNGNTNGNTNGKGLQSFRDSEAARMRLFEPERERREYLLDTEVIRALENFADYLEQAFGKRPSTGGIVETLVLQSLNDQSEFQEWCKSAAVTSVKNFSNGKEQLSPIFSGSNSSDEDDLLTELGG